MTACSRSFVRGSHRHSSRRFISISDLRFRSHISCSWRTPGSCLTITVDTLREHARRLLLTGLTSATVSVRFHASIYSYPRTDPCTREWLYHVSGLLQVKNGMLDYHISGAHAVIAAKDKNTLSRLSAQTATCTNLTYIRQASCPFVLRWPRLYDRRTRGSLL